MTEPKTVKPLAVQDWDPALAQVVEDMKGRPLNVHSLMARHPALLKAWWSFRNYSVAGGDLGRRGAELVILRVAIHMRAWYEWASHVERGLACGLTIEEIERVKEGPGASQWDDRDRLLLRAVDELVDAHALSERTLSALGEHYTARQIMDMMAIHGMYVILGCMINTWGLDLDDHVAKKLPAGLTQEQFEAEFPRGFQPEALVDTKG